MENDISKRRRSHDNHNSIESIEPMEKEGDHNTSFAKTQRSMGKKPPSSKDEKRDTVKSLNGTSPSPMKKAEMHSVRTNKSRKRKGLKPVSREELREVFVKFR